MTVEKIREDKLRRVAARRGIIVRKVRRNDKLAADYGLFELIRYGARPIMGPIDEIEKMLR